MPWSSGDSLSPSNLNRVGFGASSIYNVEEYGATGDGATDDRVAIQTALDAASDGGGGIVYCPSGDYALSSRTHTKDASINICLQIAGGVSLLGAGMSATTLSLLSNVADNTRTIMNNTPASFTDNDVRIADLSIDGNSSLFTAPGHFRVHGIVPNRVTNLVVERVRVSDLYGTDSGGTGEAFAISADLCDSFVIKDCFVVDGASSLGASGNTTNRAQFGHIENCTVRDTSSLGYTCYRADNLVFSNCFVENPVNHGFNCEDSRNVIWMGCTASGGSDTAASQYGFVTAAGSYGPQWIGCSGISFPAAGWFLAATGTSGWLDSSGSEVASSFATGTNEAIFIGGVARDNALFAVTHQGGRVSGILPQFSNNSGTLNTSDLADLAVVTYDDTVRLSSAATLDLTAGGALSLATAADATGLTSGELKAVFTSSGMSLIVSSGDSIYDIGSNTSAGAP